MSKPSPAYRITCPTCGAAPWHPCVVAEDSRFKDFIGTTKKRPHKTRSIDGKELAVHDKHYKDVECPSCGALPNEACMRISKNAKNVVGFVYTSPDPTIRKRSPCSTRVWRANGMDFLDHHESAAESGMLVPPEWHESAAETGILEEAHE